MLVQNNKPTITSIDLYTDLDMNDVIDTSGVHVLPTSSGTTGFIVRNNQFSIRVNAEAVNGAISYDLALPTGSDASEDGGVYTFTGFGTDGEKTFTLKVADSLGLESAEFTFKVTYENTDITPPSVEFFELNTLIATGANLNTGSISPDGGHIETRGTSDYSNTIIADPDVSGKIILRGTARDNQRLTSVSLTLGSETFTILSWNGTAMAPATGASVVSQNLGVAGHDVEWAYVWDTSTIRDAVQRRYALQNAVVSAAAQDAAGQDSTTNTYDGLIPSYNDMTVDVLPYITKVTTNLSKLKKNNPSVYNRTALGRYPVNATEIVTIEGYNLTSAVVRNAANTADVTISIVNGVVSIPAESVAQLASGELAMTVNGIPLLNNNNDNDVETNKKPNGDNNLLLTDDVVLDIWDINSAAALPISGTLKEPVMRINPYNDMLGFAFTNGAANFSMGAGRDNGYSYERWQSNYAAFNNVAYAIDANGYSHAIAIGLDTYPDGNNDYMGRFTYMNSRWGYCDRYNMNDNYSSSNKLRLEWIGVKNVNVKGTMTSSCIMDENRFRSPCLATAVHGSDTSVYLAYYDDIQGQIRFRYGSVAPSSRNNFGQFVDPHGNITADYTKTAKDADEDNFSVLAGLDRDLNPATNTPVNKAGEYVAIDVIPGNTVNEDTVVAVWYDGSDLKYSYKVNPATDNDASNTHETGYWSAAKTIFTDGGTHCAIKVDANKGIHIAAYDTSGADLRYAYLKNYNSTYDEDTQSCVVDNYAIVGTNISIDVVLKNINGKNQAIPYISYYNASTQRPKLAYLVTPTSGDMNYTLHGSDENEFFTGKWEVTVIPTSSTVCVDRTNVALWKTSAGVLKDASDITKGTSYSNTSDGKQYTNGTNNPILGYAVKVNTSGAIETAQKK